MRQELTQQPGVRFRAVDLMVTRMGSACIAVDRRTGRAARLSRAVVELLHGCSRFATLDQHAERAAVDGPRDVMRRELARLAGDGWLESPQEILADIRGGDEPPGALSANPHIAMVTRNRGALVERACRALGLSLTLYDDSDDETDAAARASALGQAVFLRSQREAMARRHNLSFLLESCPGLERSAGVNRNAALLDAGRRPVLFFDDDVLGKARMLGGGLVLSGDAHPEHVEWYPDRQTALDQAHEGRIVALHGPLGCSLSELVRRFEPSPDAPWWDDLPPNLSARARLGSVTVGATMFGQLGDTATGDTHWQLHLRGASAARALRNWEGVRLNREVCRAPRALVVNGSPAFITMASGIDARRFVPPFFPAGRNTDGLWGRMLRLVDPDAWIGRLPAALQHDPPDVREASEEWLHFGAGRLEITEIVDQVLLSQVQLRGGDPPDRLAQIADVLGLVSRWSVPVFTEWLRERWRLRLAHTATSLEHSLRSFPQGAWRSDLEIAIERCRGAAIDGTVPPVVEIPERGADAQVAVMRRVLAAFGDDLQRWVEVW